MKLGMNLMLWATDVTGEEYLPLFERLKAIGFDGVEVPIFQPDPAAIGALAGRLRDMGLDCMAVTVTNAEQSLISPDAAVRRTGMDHLKGVLECCQAGGMSILAGPVYAGLADFSGSAPTQAEWDRGVESLQELSPHAATCGVTIALEYLNRFEIYLLTNAADTARFVADVGHPSTQMMIDTFHAHIEEKDVGKAITDHADSIVHLQLAECDRSTPGAGQVHWDRIFGALAEIGYDGWLSIEAFGTGLPAIAKATSIWRKMYDTEEQLAADGFAFIRDRWAAASAAGSGS